MSKIEFLDP